ncbi:GntR family transcriptional regulator [Rothia sp. AR01]|uniref:GntR family transcriptional regulator n=1 Tax=Rothia santali TaxID=2949643 RepID=A0A9X2KJ69_9MICC|nr:GntR family transcriptional regulator [Rothia santali]MCP3426549.1 GntR family transcriptional regulator [Rothia santali]
MTAELVTAAPAPSASMAERTYHTLRDRLTLLDIAPGAPLSEAALSRELDVGRTPLREALKRLEADHLVVTFARRGTFAANVDLTEITPISEMRRVLVPLAAHRAASFTGGEVRGELAEALDAIRETASDADRRHLMELDLRVHRLISQAARSPHLEEALVRLDNLVTRMWCLIMDRLPPMEGHIGEHLALVERILAGDEERAERLAREHVAHFDDAARSVL